MRRFTVFVLLAVLGATVGGVVYQQRRGQGSAEAGPASTASASNETALEHAKRHVDPRYVCPMHPEVVSDQPGKCPLCGMALVSRDTEEAAVDTHVNPASGAASAGAQPLTLSSAVINQLGVRTGKVRRGTLARHIEAFGSVLPDGLATYQFTNPSADPNQVPKTIVVAQVHERYALAVRGGQSASVRLPMPGAALWKGTVETVDRQVTPGARTLQFRIAMDPDTPALKPGMAVRVDLDIDPIEGVLLLPREAVIRTSTESRVILALGDGQFAPREVQAEDLGADEVVIRSGLDEGEEVVVSGQFLLDSEASLQAGLRRLSDERTGTPAGAGR